jgi:sugar/nucleoside kinase (ribokinase family)
VIVVIGCPTGRLDDGRVTAGGTASTVAIAAAGGGRQVQLVGRIGDDATADAILLDLASAGVGHVALLRDPARPTPLETTPTADDVADAHDDAGVRPSAASEGVRTLLLEAADVELGLRYLTDYRVIVLADQVAPEVVAVAVDAARWGAARLVVILEPGAAVPDPVPVDATVIEAPASDPDGAFAALVGRFAAALDEGTAPGDAFLGSLAAAGGTEATPS